LKSDLQASPLKVLAGLVERVTLHADARERLNHARLRIRRRLFGERLHRHRPGRPRKSDSREDRRRGLDQDEFARLAPEHGTCPALGAPRRTAIRLAGLFLGADYYARVASRRTSIAGLSSRRQRKTVCRRSPSSDQLRYVISATTSGLTQWTFNSARGPPKRCFRGGALARGVVLTANGRRRSWSMTYLFGREELLFLRDLSKKTLPMIVTLAVEVLKCRL
jgi:hypothetical protein